MLNSLQEFLSNQGCESLVETSLDTLGWLVRNLNRVLQQEKWEIVRLLDSQPDSSIFMEFLHSVGRE